MKIEIEDIQELIKGELSSILEQKFETLQKQMSRSQGNTHPEQIESLTALIVQLNEKADVLKEEAINLLNAFHSPDERMDLLVRAVSKMEREKDIIHSCEKSQRKFMKHFYTSIFVSVGLAILFSISLSCNIIWKEDLSRAEVNDIKYRYLFLRNYNRNYLLKLDSLCNNKDRFEELREEVIQEEEYNNELARKQVEIQHLERKTREKQIEMDNLKRKF